MYRETGYAFDGGTMQGLVPTLVGLVSADSSVSIGSNLGEMIGGLPMSTLGITSAGKRTDCERAREPEQAAEALFICCWYLCGLFAGYRPYILASRLAGAAADSGQVTKYRNQRPQRKLQRADRRPVRASKLGDSFATWIEKNWQQLVKNPAAGGQSTAAVPRERVVAERRRLCRPLSVSQLLSRQHFQISTSLHKLQPCCGSSGAPFCPI
jgi:hypothetical protein